MKGFSLLGLRSCLLVFLVFSFYSCRKDGAALLPSNQLALIYDTSVITEWNSTLETIEQAYGAYRPCPITTTVAYLGLANYELCVPGMPEYRSIAGNYLGLDIPKSSDKQLIYWRLAINACSATMLSKFFPKDIQKILETETKLFNQYSANLPDDLVKASIKRGREVAEAVFDFSKSDLFTFEGNLNTSPIYNVLQGDGYWKPTAPDFLPGKFPQWGKGRTFAAKNTDKTIDAPIAFSTDPNSAYYKQMLEVYQYSKNKTFDQKWIAEFWSDDIAGLSFSPPVRWFAIATQVYNASNCTLQKALVTNTKIGLALNDAAVACWDNKYKYQTERPITFIRKYIDPTWLSALTKDGITPNFPGYPSGHASFSGAAAEVLSYEFGTDFALIDRCHAGRTEFVSIPRPYTSFFQMAEENALSRIYLGVHVKMDADAGLDLGYKLGKSINSLPFGK